MRYMNVYFDENTPLTCDLSHQVFVRGFRKKECLPFENGICLSCYFKQRAGPNHLTKIATYNRKSLENATAKNARIKSIGIIDWKFILSLAS